MRRRSKVESRTLQVKRRTLTAWLLLGGALALPWGATNVCLYTGLGVWLIRKVTGFGSA